MSDGRLALVVLTGLTTTLGLALWRPPAWLLIGSMALAAAAFGAWGIADRELAERGATRSLSTQALSVVRGSCLVLGACAGIVALFSLLGVALGTWIS
jgi:hypothetical protein